MAILEALKRRYKRKKVFKESQKRKKKQDEYARYRSAYLSNPKHKTKNMQTYAQWHEDKYEKYEKAKPAKPPMRRSSTNKKEESAAGLLTSYARRTGKPKTK